MSRELRDRIRRARRRQIGYRIEARDPLVLEVESGHSGRSHTVVPHIAYCGCEDRKYRQLPCWHLCALAIDEDVDRRTRSAVLEGIANHTTDIELEIDDLHDRIEELHDRHETWNEATDELAREAGVVREPLVTGGNIEFTPLPERRDKPRDVIARIAATAGGS